MARRDFWPTCLLPFRGGISTGRLGVPGQGFFYQKFCKNCNRILNRGIGSRFGISHIGHDHPEGEVKCHWPFDNWEFCAERGLSVFGGYNIHVPQGVTLPC